MRIQQILKHNIDHLKIFKQHAQPSLQHMLNLKIISSFSKILLTLLCSNNHLHQLPCFKQSWHRTKISITDKLLSKTDSTATFCSLSFGRSVMQTISPSVATNKTWFLLCVLKFKPVILCWPSCMTFCLLCLKKKAQICHRWRLLLITPCKFAN